MTDDDKPPPPTFALLDFPATLTEEEESDLLETLVTKRNDPISFDRAKKEAARRMRVTVAAVEARIKQLAVEIEGVNLEAAAELTAIAVSRAKLWQNADRVPFATISAKEGHRETYPVNSDGFQDWLSNQYGQGHQVALGDDGMIPLYPSLKQLKEATHQISAHARRGPELSPRVRVNYHAGALWLDLGDCDWRCVRITADGWELRKRQHFQAPIIRSPGIRALPVPERGGDIDALAEFVNLEAGDFVLFCGVAAGLLNTFGNYTTTMLLGPAGSGKTTATRVLRRLIDPHKLDTRPFTGKRDLMHGAGVAHVIGLENVSAISDDLSDAICRLNTGMGYSERELYAQGKEFMISPHCPVLINGIPGNLATREDLADRTITFGFPLLGERVVSDDLLWRRFNLALPKLLGVILDGAVAALRTRRDFNEDNDAAAEALLNGWRPRFVDFAVWAEAACREMGFAPGEFAAAYRHNLEYALRYLAEHNPVCVGIRKLLEARATWQGYPEELLKAIRPYCTSVETPLRASNWFAREDLPRAIPLLAKVYDIHILTGRRLAQNDNRNGIEISRGNHSAPDLVPDGAPSTPEPAEEFTEELGTPAYSEPEPSPPAPTMKRRFL